MPMGTDAILEAGEHLQWLVKNAPPPPPDAYIVPFCSVLLDICKENMSRRLIRGRGVKFGIGSADEVPQTTVPPWCTLATCNIYMSPNVQVIKYSRSRLHISDLELARRFL